MADRPRIIVFGSVGQGKSSLINTLAGKVVVKASDNATGVTFSSSEVHVASPDGVECTFIDTVGLNEGRGGTVEGKAAFLALRKLLGDASSKGFSLGIMVHQGRLTDESFAKNYDIFISHIFHEAGVPVILVKTGLDDSEVDFETGWYSQNKAVVDRLYPDFVDVDGGCCATSTNKKLEVLYKEAREKLADTLWAKIEQHRVPGNKKLKGSTTLHLLRIWNQFCKIIGGAPGWLFDIVGLGFAGELLTQAAKCLVVAPKALIDALMAVGLDWDEAVDVANDMMLIHYGL